MLSIPRQDVAVLVIDMQRAFFDSNSTLGRAGLDVEALKPAIPGSVSLVAAARKAEIPVIFTRYVYHKGLADFGNRPGVDLEKRKAENSLGVGNSEIEIIDDLDVRPDDIVIDKSRPSAFYGTRLEPVLSSLGIRNLLICGVTTNICVESTARDAGQRDYGTYVVRDAVAEFTPERNHYALYSIAWCFGSVVDLAEVTTSWRA